MANVIRILVDLSLPLSILLKITVVLAVGWAMHFWLARRNPRWRVLMWRAVMSGVVLVTILALGAYWQVSIEPPPEAIPPEITPLKIPIDSLENSPAAMGGGMIGSYPSKEYEQMYSPSAAAEESVAAPSFSLWNWTRQNTRTIVLIIWAIGTIILAVRFFILFNHIRRKISAATPAPQRLQQQLNRIADELGYRKNISLRCSDQLSSPFLYGLRRPVVVLPQHLIDPKQAHELPAILAHEVAHLLSYDLYWLLAVRWFSILLWFHPLVWKLSLAHHKACEEVCDGIAADYVGSVELYSGILARVALKMAGQMPAVGGVAMLRSANIVQRLKKLKRQINFYPLARHWVAISLTVGLFALAGIGGVKLVYAQDTTSSLQMKNLTSQQGTFEALVRHQKDKQPIALVQIQVEGNNVKGFRINEVYVIFTDKNGLARIDLPPGDYVINVRKGYMRNTNTRDMGFNIVPNKVTHLDIYLGDSAKKTSGSVIDPQGRPVEGAWVRLVPGSIRDDIIWDHITDAQGNFELIYSDRSIERFIVARHPKTNRAGSIEFMNTFGTKSKFLDQGSQIKLEPGFTFKGKVTDPYGQGIGWAQVQVKILTGRGDLPIVIAYTDRYGQFEIKALPTDQSDYYIRTSKAGYGPLFIQVLDKTVAGNTTFDVPNIVLKPTDQSVSGVVVDASGKPVAEAAIRAYGKGQEGKGQPERYTTADAQGKFTIEKVCKGKLRVQASKRNKMLFGQTDTEGGQKNIKITTRYNPQSNVPSYIYQKKPVFLTGQPLPKLDIFRLALEPQKIKGKSLLLCFWDLQQHQSQYYLRQLAEQAQKLTQKDIIIIGIQSSKVDNQALQEWLRENKIPFIVSMIEKDVEETKFNWGVQTLPWLIITDKQHKVLGEGFSLDQVDTFIK